MIIRKIKARGKIERVCVWGEWGGGGGGGAEAEEGEELRLLTQASAPRFLFHLENQID